MDVRPIQAAILERGITITALDQVVAQVVTRFGDTTPRPADLAAFLDSLDVWTKVGLGKEEFLALPGSERMTLARSFEPPVVVHPRRPVTRVLTPAELAAHDAQAAREGWSRAEYTERARQLQQTPAPPPQP